MKLKLTRKSYNRKLIMFAATAFSAVGLISTGFAAWVISSNATGNAESNVEVGAISDASIQIKDLAVDSSFRFDADSNDKSGRVQYKGEAGKGENMDVTISGTVTNVQFLDTLTYTMTLPANVKEAVDAGYLTFGYELQTDDDDNLITVTDSGYAGSYITVAQSINVDTTSNNYDADKDEYAFSFTFSFGWGEEFDNVNPSIYFDDTGADIADETVVTIMRTFRTMLAGEEIDDDAEIDNLQYKVEVKATTV